VSARDSYTDHKELMGGGRPSLNGWPGNQGTASEPVSKGREGKYRENSGVADGGERPAPIPSIATGERK